MIANDIIDYPPNEFCNECKGHCCKSMGCHFSPNDFKELTFEALKTEIEKGFISIDAWDGNPLTDDIGGRTYYLRMRNKYYSDKKYNIVDFSWGGKCILLTENGCPLEFNNRPKGGRSLKPEKKK